MIRPPNAATTGIATMRNLPAGAGVWSFSSRVMAVVVALFPAVARASLLPPELEDTVADIVAWVVLVVTPIAGITIFWLVHILPEKIAEKRKHPQAKAIHTLCLLSLFFGGLLWPIAWLWAYTKPVMYKLAYGTDVAEPEHAVVQPAAAAVPKPAVAMEMRLLEKKIAELEAQVAQQMNSRGGPS